MFAPSAGVAEDPVCGTANALAMPYWIVAKNISESDVVLAKQVSARGGEIRILLNAEKRRMKLVGQVRSVCRGELYV
jgi:predicted PhzF superfamily epimerase YddE/YHI9